MPFLSVIDRTIWAILRNRWVGMVCVVAGLALTTLGLFADLIGPGSGSGFPGLRQQIAVVGGLFTIFVGAVSLSNQTDKLRTRLYNYVTGHGHVLYVPSRNTQLWIMTAVVLVITIPRFYGLDLRPLWFDELESWKRIQYSNLGDVIRLGAGSEPWPPGYHIILYLGTTIFGDSEFSLRIMSAFAGVVSGAAIYQLGRRLLGIWEGIFAALLLGFLQIMIHYSQEARAYALLILFSMLSWYFWLQLVDVLKKLPARRRAATIGYLVTALMCMYLHYYGILLIAVQGLGMLTFGLRQPQRLLRVAETYGLVGVGYIPWIPKFFSDLFTSTTSTQPPMPVEAELYRLLERSLNYNPILTSIGITFMLASIGAFYFRAIRQSGTSSFRPFALNTSVPFLLFWALVPFTIAYVKSVAMTPTWDPRYLLIVMPAFELLVIGIPAHLGVPTRFRLPVLFVMVAVLSWTFVFTHDYYRLPGMNNVRALSAHIMTVTDDLDGEALIISEPAMHFDYYFEQAGWQRNSDSLGLSTDEVLELIDDTQAPYVWHATDLVLDRPPVIRTDAHLVEHYDVVAEDTFEFATLRTTLYRRKDLP